MITAGIDAGTKTVKALILQDRTVTSKSIPYPGDESTDDSARRSLQEALEEAHTSEGRINYIMATGGGGRYVSFADGYAADFTCLCKGMDWLYPRVRTIVDIGSDKTLVVKCVDGKPAKVARNDKCAAGTGRYLEKVCDILRVSLDEMTEGVETEGEMLEIQNTCAVFAESEIISLIHQKKRSEDILRGVFQSLALRIYTQLLDVGIEKDVAMTGGVSRATGLKSALEEQIKLPILVPDHPEMIAALGAAVIAQGKVL